MNGLFIILARPAAFHLMVLVVIAAYGFLRLFTFSGLSADEAEQVLFAKSFQ